MESLCKQKEWDFSKDFPLLVTLDRASDSHRSLGLLLCSSKLRTLQQRSSSTQESAGPHALVGGWPVSLQVLFLDNTPQTADPLMAAYPAGTPTLSPHRQRPGLVGVFTVPWVLAPGGKCKFVLVSSGNSIFLASA